MKKIVVIFLSLMTNFLSLRPFKTVRSFTTKNPTPLPGLQAQTGVQTELQLKI